MVLVIDSQQMDLVSKYHYSNLCLINDIPEGRAFIESKLSRFELTISRYLIKRQYKLGTGLGKCNGILELIEAKGHDTTFGLGL